MKIMISLLSLLLAAPALALSPNQHVDNFKLLDHRGMAHELYYHSDAQALVFMVQANGCPIVGSSLPQLQKLRAAYQVKGIEFLMINSSLEDNRSTIIEEALAQNIDFPILVDDTQLVGESLQLNRSGEIFVVNPKNWNIVFHGPVGSDLNSALDNIIAGKPVKVASVEAPGCAVSLAGNDKESREAHVQISYSETISPMLRDNCVTCHRAGGMGPFAMTDYNIIKGFSPMIREVIRTKRMPPWHADPHFGEFSNDRSLSTEQVQNLVHWIEAGSPRGEGPDLLAEDKRVWPKYRMGEPDFVIDIPSTDVPATGIVDYQYKYVDNPLTEDAWIAGTEVIPGDNKALHHVIGMYGKYNPDPNAKRKFLPMGGAGGYAPGTDAGFYPDAAGKYLPADAKFQFQMHYTSYGKKTVDATQIGVWLHKEKPQYVMEGRFIANTDIHIPANTKRHTETEEFTFSKDAILYSLLPHSHFRGIASDFVAVYPDGSRETLLSVPNYDFNWQTDYTFLKPKIMLAGTVVLHSTTYDNSEQNPSNPDPSIDVYWGDQSFEEMLFASLSYRYLDKDELAAAVDQLSAR
ncbi:MAG: redoxin domain-containing protein [Oceanicoccus sp.]